MTRFEFEAVEREALLAVEAEGLRPVARRTGISLGVLRSIAEKRDLSVSNALALAAAFDFEVTVQPKRFSNGFAEDSQVSDLTRKEALRSGFLPIPWHQETRLKGSAPIAFSQTWLAAEGLIPDFLNAVVPDVSNVLNAPAKNTVAIIQTNAPKKGNSGIWCYKDGATIGIAKTAFADGLAILLPLSDNDDARIITETSNVAIKLLGKVVWSGHSWSERQ